MAAPQALMAADFKTAPNSATTRMRPRVSVTLWFPTWTRAGITLSCGTGYSIPAVPTSPAGRRTLREMVMTTHSHPIPLRRPIQLIPLQNQRPIQLQMVMPSWSSTTSRRKTGTSASRWTILTPLYAATRCLESQSIKAMHGEVTTNIITRERAVSLSIDMRSSMMVLHLVICCLFQCASRWHPVEPSLYGPSSRI